MVEVDVVFLSCARVPFACRCKAIGKESILGFDLSPYFLIQIKHASLIRRFLALMITDAEITQEFDGIKKIQLLVRDNNMSVPGFVLGMYEANNLNSALVARGEELGRISCKTSC